jgi:hypothetical protein
LKLSNPTLRERFRGHAPALSLSDCKAEIRKRKISDVSVRFIEASG